MDGKGLLVERAANELECSSVPRRSRHDGGGVQRMGGLEETKQGWLRMRLALSLVGFSNIEQVITILGLASFRKNRIIPKIPRTHNINMNT